MMGQINKLLLLVMLVGLLPELLPGQESKIVTGKDLYVGISLGHGWTSVKGKVMVPSIAGLTITDGTAFSGSVLLGYRFNRYLGISSGIGYASFVSNLSLNNYQSKFTAVDSEGENYEMRITAIGITEDQKIGYLYVPVCVNLRLPLTQTLGLFLEPGVNLCFPVVSSFEGSGTFTYKGYYPKYNVLLENLPGYGFPANNKLTAKADMELKPFSVMASLSGGVDYFLNDKVQLLLSATCLKSLSNISSYTGNEKYQLSGDSKTFNSLMGGSASSSAQSVEVSVKIRYYF